MALVHRDTADHTDAGDPTWPCKARSEPVDRVAWMMAPA